MGGLWRVCLSLERDGGGGKVGACCAWVRKLSGGEAVGRVMEKKRLLDGSGRDEGVDGDCLEKQALSLALGAGAGDCVCVCVRMTGGWTWSRSEWRMVVKMDDARRRSPGASTTTTTTNGPISKHLENHLHHREHFSLCDSYTALCIHV